MLDLQGHIITFYPNEMQSSRKKLIMTMLSYLIHVQCILQSPNLSSPLGDGLKILEEFFSFYHCFLRFVTQIHLINSTNEASIHAGKLELVKHQILKLIYQYLEKSMFFNFISQFILSTLLKLF